MSARAAAGLLGLLLCPLHAQAMDLQTVFGRPAKETLLVSVEEYQQAWAMAWLSAGEIDPDPNSLDCPGGATTTTTPARPDSTTTTTQATTTTPTTTTTLRPGGSGRVATTTTLGPTKPLRLVPTTTLPPAPVPRGTPGGTGPSGRSFAPEGPETEGGGSAMGRDRCGLKACWSVSGDVVPGSCRVTRMTVRRAGEETGRPIREGDCSHDARALAERVCEGIAQRARKTESQFCAPAASGIPYECRCEPVLYLDERDETLVRESVGEENCAAPGEEAVYLSADAEVKLRAAQGSYLGRCTERRK